MVRMAMFHGVDGRFHCKIAINVPFVLWCGMAMFYGTDVFHGNDKHKRAICAILRMPCSVVRMAKFSVQLT